MATAWTVFLKETRDNLRDRRTLLSALLLGPTLGPVLFVALMQLAIQQQLKGEDELPLQVINAGLAPNLMQTLTAHGASITAIDAAADPKEIISADPDALVLRVPEDIQQRYREARTATLAIYYDRSRSAASNRADRLAGMLEAQGSQLASLRLQARGIAPEVIAPLRVQRIDVSTPMARSVLVFGMLPYFLLLATIMGAFYVAIDSTAGERERGSLEPLLNLPISRGELVLGKLAAAAAFSAVSLTLTVTMFALVFPYVDLGGLGIRTELEFGQVLRILAVTLPFAAFAAGLLTLVASYAKSYKEAQTYLSIVMLVPLVPVIIGTVMQAEPSAIGALIPGFSQHLIILEIIKGMELPATYLLYSAGTTLLAATLMALGAVWLYRSERILG